MSRKRIARGIKRITTFLVVIGLFTGFAKWMMTSIKYPEFSSSSAAYHAVYGCNPERLEVLDVKAKSMGYEDFNDYRVRTWY